MAGPRQNIDQVVAIDGPSGSGKSTVAQRIAARLNLLYIDTGAMYRAVAYAMDKKGVNGRDLASVRQALADIQLEYAPSPGVLVRVDGEDVTQVIREHRVSDLASQLSGLAPIREFLLKFQRTLPQGGVCVMEGRDIGSVVFPHAFAKFFVSASLPVRAQRRLAQLQNTGDSVVHFDEVLGDVKERDERDSQRSVAPLVQPEDAVFVDTSDMQVDAVTEHLARIVKEKAAQVGINLAS